MESIIILFLFGISVFLAMIVWILDDIREISRQIREIYSDKLL